MALGGAVVGLVAVIISLLVRAPTQALEQRKSPRQLIGLRIFTVGFVVALVGWLTAVFLYGTLGYWVAVVGVLSGVAGIIIHNVNLVRSRLE